MRACYQPRQFNPPCLHRAALPQARPRSHRCRAHSSSSNLPSTLEEVSSWAAAECARQVEAGVPSLPKACLLLALEEEAALQQSYAQAEHITVSGTRHVGDASSWSLERLDALAAEATVLFYSACQALGVVDAVQLAAEGAAPDSTLWTLHLDLVHSYPTHLLSAVNTVLFERHGYRRMARHGNPRDSRLSAVLELGQGSPATLAVIYLEICARLGLLLHAAALEGGRYFLLWPADPAVPLSAGGERLVIDPLAGDLISLAEVLELFGEESLRPASNAEILAALCAVLRDAHWCRAVHCSPEPGLMVPISVQLALHHPYEAEAAEPQTSSSSSSSSGASSSSNKQRTAGRWPRQGLSLARALAATQKRAQLLPKDPQAQLHHALLLFFSREYEEAWQELGCVVQAERELLGQGSFSVEELASMRVLWEKLRLLLEFA